MSLIAFLFNGKHLHIWLHDFLHTAHPGRRPQFVSSKAPGFPAFFKGLNCNIEPDFVAIFETIGNRSGRIVYAHFRAFDAMCLFRRVQGLRSADIFLRSRRIANV